MKRAKLFYLTNSNSAIKTMLGNHVHDHRDFVRVQHPSLCCNQCRELVPQNSIKYFQQFLCTFLSHNLILAYLCTDFKITILWKILENVNLVPHNLVVAELENCLRSHLRFPSMCINRQISRTHLLNMCKSLYMRPFLCVYACRFCMNKIKT